MAIATTRKADSQPLPISKKTTKVQKAYRANTAAKRDTVVNTKPTTATATTSAAKDMQPQLDRIAASAQTPYQKRVLSLLCQVPRGSVTTYALMARHLGSSPRAVGNAMRRNPFAPEVPCHRCVATGGGLGGFKGQWPRDGEGITLDEKRVLLRGEGVKMDSGGRVLGTPFGGFL